MLRNRKIFLVILLALFMFFSLVSISFSAQKVEEYIPDMEVSEEGMTIGQIIKSGGAVMIVLGLLSIAALSLVVYYFITIKQEKLLPAKFLDRSVVLVEEGRYAEAKEISKNTSNLISDVLRAGLVRMDHEEVVIKEAMQDQGRRSVDNLWQRLSYLADIAAIAPMAGLLGTVLGMIQAFNVIAFRTGAVKPILLASGISKAMVTTAAGLIIAIPTMIFYSFFRGKVRNAAVQLENICTELYHLIVKNKRAKEFVKRTAMKKEVKPVAKRRVRSKKKEKMEEKKNDLEGGQSW